MEYKKLKDKRATDLGKQHLLNQGLMMQEISNLAMVFADSTRVSRTPQPTSISTPSMQINMPTLCLVTAPAFDLPAQTLMTSSGHQGT